MDNQRLLVWGAFVLLLWFTYQTWLQDYGPAPVQPTAVIEPTEPADTVDSIALPEVGDVPTQAPPGSLPGDTAVAASDDGRTIRVITDVLDLQISMLGGTLVQATMLDYPVHKDQPDKLILCHRINIHRFDGVFPDLVQ